MDLLGEYFLERLGGAIHLNIFGSLMVTAIMLSPVAASAADLTVILKEPIAVAERNSGKCNASLEGEIVPGDAQKVADFVASMAPLFDTPGSSYASYVGDGLNLCISGPGGSFSEALKIVAVLSENFVWAIVPPGKSCLSACAVAFMGGIYADESGRSPARQLTPGADLGFHAPSITLQGDTPMPPQMVEAAYKTALTDIHGVMTALLVNVGFSYEASMRPSLFATMLGTPPDKMFHVTTIDEIGRWGISFHDGENDSLNLSPANLIQVCRNLAQWRHDQVSTSTADLAYEGSFPAVRMERQENTSQYNDDEIWLYRISDGMFDTECTYHIPRDLKRITDNSIQVEVWQEDDTTRNNSWPFTWQYLNPSMTLAEAAERAKQK